MCPCPVTPVSRMGSIQRREGEKILAGAEGSKGVGDLEAVTVRGLEDDGTCRDECSGRRECVGSGGVMGCGECEAAVVGWEGR